MNRITGLILMFTLKTFFANSQATLINITVIPLDSAVRYGRLDNGFTYYIRHNDYPKARTVMYLVNKIGSILEDDDQRGLAHFVEHMTFNGTTHYPKNTMVDYLQKAGVRFGADINAYTGFDETVYQLPIPSDEPEVLANGLRIMRDWAQNATFDPKEIARERGVILEEKRLGKGAEERMRRQYLPIIFNHSRYAKRIPIGVDTILNNFKTETIKRFYRDWYRPDQQALIIVGDINADSLVQVVKMQFGDLVNPLNEKPRKRYPIVLTGKNQYIALTDKEATATNLEILIKHPEVLVRTEKEYRESLMRSLIIQMLSGRYDELLKQAAPPFLHAGASTSRTEIPGLFVYSARLISKPGQLEAGFKALWRESVRIKRYGFLPEELARAKRISSSSLKSAYKERDKTPSSQYVNQYMDNVLNQDAEPGWEKRYKIDVASLSTISLEEINKLVKVYISENNRDVIITAPQEEKNHLPDEQTMNTWFSSVENEDVQPYHDDVAGRTLLSVSPVPGKVISTKELKDLNIIEWTLSNGMKVFFKLTKFKNDQVTFTAFASGGTAMYSDHDFMSAANAAYITNYSGIADFTPTQLTKLLTGKLAAVSTFIDENYEGVNGYAAPEDLETALQLVFLYFTHPREDTAIVNNSLKRFRVSLEGRSNDPSTVFGDTVAAVLGNHDYRRTGWTIAKVDQINIDRSFKIYKELFADAGKFTFVFVGNIDTAAVRPLLEKYLAGLSVIHRDQQPQNLGFFPPQGKVNKTVYKGTEPKATVNLTFSGSYVFNQANNKNMDALAEVLKLRLTERLREEESGVYSPSVSIISNKSPRAYYQFTISFGCAPVNVEKLIASTLDEAVKLKTKGPLQVNIDKYKAEDRRSHETALQNNYFWLNYLSGALKNKEDLNQVNDYDRLVNAITVKSLKESAAQYLNDDNYVRLVLLPEKSER